MPLSSSPRPKPISGAWTKPSRGATSAACSAGCAPRSTRQGQRYRPAALIEHITGSKPDHRPLIDGLRRKYEELYGI